jgi:DNA-binding response OmpR family regulator
MLDVIILEDDPEVCRILVHAAETDGNRASAYDNIKDFTQATHDHSFDIFLIDVGLPDGNGMALLQALRGRTNGGIIMVTGSGDEIDAVLSLELGADDYVTKPFRIRELRARIKAVARRLKPGLMPPEGEGVGDRNAVYTVNDLTINRQSRSVRKQDGTEIDLTTLEFDLLLALTGRVNVVRSRDELMDSVRGPDWSAYDRNIDGLISRLRAKLFVGDQGSNCIRTVRGVGYMFCVEG